MVFAWRWAYLCALFILGVNVIRPLIHKCLYHSNLQLRQKIN
jgi:hypothetical protein